MEVGSGVSVAVAVAVAAGVGVDVGARATVVAVDVGVNVGSGAGTAVAVEVDVAGRDVGVAIGAVVAVAVVTDSSVGVSSSPVQPTKIVNARDNPTNNSAPCGSLVRRSKCLGIEEEKLNIGAANGRFSTNSSEAQSAKNSQFHALYTVLAQLDSNADAPCQLAKHEPVLTG